jgi:hypothetical protein
MQDIKRSGQFRSFWTTFDQSVNLMASGETVVQSMWSPAVTAVSLQNRLRCFYKAVPPEEVWSMMGGELEMDLAAFTAALNGEQALAAAAGAGLPRDPALDAFRVLDPHHTGQIGPEVLRVVFERLLGDGPLDDADVQALVAQLGLQSTVILPGRVPHAEVDRYASLIDVFCFPRRRLRLTELVTPLKPLEAMAMGRPVLASDVGGHRELIRDRVTGRLFPAGDPDALAAAIVDLFDHPEDWAALGIAGRRYVEHHRRWSASVAAYVPAYAALLGEHFDSSLKVRGGMRHA